MANVMLKPGEDEKAVMNGIGENLSWAGGFSTVSPSTVESCM